MLIALTLGIGLHLQTLSGTAQKDSLAAVSSSLVAVDLPEAPSVAARGLDSGGQGGDVRLEDKPHAPVTLLGTPKHMATDALHIVTFPVYLRKGDLKWMLPVAAATAAALATDSHTMLEVVSRSNSVSTATVATTGFNESNISASNVLLGGMIGVPAALFGVGQFTHNDHARETGILAGQAVIEAYVADEVVKLASFRERPLADHAQGEFYIGNAGANSSFISGHSIMAWSSAAVLAGEYNRPWQQAGVYTLATGVSLTRVLGQQHFPSDVLLGAVSGWLIGHYVYRAHHHHVR